MPDLVTFPAPADGTPDFEMTAAWRRDGFLVLRDFVDAGAIASLRAAIDRLVAEFDPSNVRTIFSTADQGHAADRYFRESGDKIRFFFEPGAFDADGELVVVKRRGLNKIGHAMHDLDADFGKFCRAPRFANLARGLGIADPRLVQSMVIFKQPNIGAEVGMHQDATFLHTDPISVIGFWLALDDADRNNGCLMAVPGAHQGPLRERFHYRDENLVMTPLTNGRNWAEEDIVPLEVPAGTLIALHGLLPHGSAPNTSSRAREAFTLHLVDGTASWSDDNWLRRDPSMPFTGFA